MDSQKTLPQPPRRYPPTTRRARKEHRCWACHRLIQPREKYRIEKYTDIDVGIYELKICLACHEITEQVFDYIEVAGSYWGDPDAGSQPEDYAEWATDTDYPDTPEKQAYRARAGLTRNAEMVP